MAGGGGDSSEKSKSPLSSTMWRVMKIGRIAGVFEQCLQGLSRECLRLCRKSLHTSTPIVTAC